MYVKNKKDNLVYDDKYEITDSVYLSDDTILSAYLDLHRLTPSNCHLLINFKPIDALDKRRLVYGVRRSYLFITKQKTIKHDRHNWRGLKNLIEDQRIHKHQHGWLNHAYNPRRYVSAIECHVACLIHPRLRLMLRDDCTNKHVYWTVTNLSNRLCFVDLDKEMANLYGTDYVNYIW
ncbi:hypothetical protein [Cysteiniphilum halobium]|uniref:hypothetical protein n=1 Tax=Cysteiniphilum halobium TaxID=2219059 RepID=UPI003F87A8EB